MQASEHLAEHAWKHPDCYGGFSPDGDYCILSRHRDSLLMDESNWEEACEELNAEAYDGGNEHFDPRPTVYHWRAGHWAVGWVECLMVRADAPQATLDAAGEILCSLADYPILNEDAYSEREFNAVCDYWERCSVRERAEYCKEHNISIFAARRAELPRDDNGYLYESLREGL